MINIAMFIAALAHTGTVDRVENDFAHVVFAFQNSENIATDIPIALLPCEISEGDVLYVRKMNGVTQISCSEPSPAAEIEVRVDPETGEIEYVIKNLQIVLE
jgi:hypothetical protein